MKRRIRHAYLSYMILEKGCRSWKRKGVEGTGADDIEAVNCLLNRHIDEVRAKPPRGIHYLRDIEICDAELQCLGDAEILTRPIYPLASDNPTTHARPSNRGQSYVRS